MSQAAIHVDMDVVAHEMLLRKKSFSLEIGNGGKLWVKAFSANDNAGFVPPNLHQAGVRAHRAQGRLCISIGSARP
eukprot:2211366-Amphidinium_carterae.1